MNSPIVFSAASDRKLAVLVIDDHEASFPDAKIFRRARSPGRRACSPAHAGRHDRNSQFTNLPTYQLTKLPWPHPAEHLTGDDRVNDRIKQRLERRDPASPVPDG